ncbi:MAG: glycoside hydrolase family 75 protein [Labilithrix sp.]|nr:glycoside hydrolase family 75 protein [Labilithrix sp.]MCW5815319.1 glycoside hydrolase family 75 protein [Labilithrix sp.]
MISASILMTTVSGCAAPTEDVGEDEAATTSLEETEPTSAAGPTGPTPAEVMAKLATCRKLNASRYAKDAGGAATIDVCGGPNGVVFFTADMDIDCDGKQSAVCNRNTDASYQPQTAGVDSKGKPLDAAALPFIVVPGVSSRWSYKSAGIKMGTVAAVIYDGKIEYGIVGDVGPQAIIGEASYAMAKRLGINPHPSYGGTSSGVTYVIFPDAKVTKNEDHAQAVRLGVERARHLVGE